MRGGFGGEEDMPCTSESLEVDDRRRWSRLRLKNPRSSWGGLLLLSRQGIDDGDFVAHSFDFWGVHIVEVV